MALVFPLSPSVGQQFTATNGVVYEWTSVGAWDRVNSVQTLRSGPTASTSSARIPAGTTAERPGASLYIGQFRYNTQIGQLEYSDGINWLAADGLDNPASLFEAQQGLITTKYSSPQTSVPKDAGGMLGSAFIPAGTTTDRPLATAYTGQFRYNTQIPEFEYSNGVTWLPLSAEAKNVASLAEAQAGIITTKYSSPETAVPKDASGMTGSAYIPAGTTAQRPTASNYAGQFRYNTQIPELEYSDGTAWLSLGLAAATLVEAQAGTLATVAATPETAVPKDASGMTGAALIPGGNTGDRPTTPASGMFRHNTTRVIVTTPPQDFLEYYDLETGTWQQLATWAQVKGVQLTAYSQELQGFIYNDTPQEPAFNGGAQVTIPAGYTDFLVNSYMSWQFNYDTTNGITSCQQALFENTTNTRIAYNAIQPGNFTNMDDLKISSTTSGSFVGSSTNSYTFQQRINKDLPFGPIYNADLGISVLAWRSI